MTKKRVVITGLGAVTPYGVGVDKFWSNLVEGKSGIGVPTIVDLERHVVKIAGEVKDFNVEEHIDPKEAKKMDRFIQFAMIAADEAVKDANLEDLTGIDPYRVGVLVSSAAGGFLTFEENHKRIIEKGIPADDITEKLVAENLDTREVPDPDLMIRTGGEKRISNYLLWQLAYSELYVTNLYWPEFGEEELVKAIKEFQSRNRRFGT